jgi:hypothetical protein
VSWEGIFAYAFPPPILIPYVLLMTDLCSETTGRVILVVLEEHPLLTPEVEETKTDVELRALPEELSNSLV